MSKRSIRIQSIQILRGIAFLEIFLGHCGIVFFTGAFGVSIFIVLSGFCMAINYLPKIEKMKMSLWSNLKYAISKIRKMYGLHVFMLGCAFVLAKMPTSKAAIRRMVLDLLLVQSWSPYSDDFFSYNGVAWYLSVYLFISIAAPYVIRGVSKIKQRKQTCFIAVLIYLLMTMIGGFLSIKQIPVGNDFAFWFTYISPIYRLAEFAMGATLGRLYLETKTEWTNNRMISTAMEMLSVAAFLGIICIFHKIEGRWNGLCYTALFTPVSMYLVYIFASGKGVVMQVMNNKPLLWLGNLSTYTFLIHQVVIRWLMVVLNGKLSGNKYLFVLTILSFAITVCGAELVAIIMKKGGKSYGK